MSDVLERREIKYIIYYKILLSVYCKIMHGCAAHVKKCLHGPQSLTERGKPSTCATKCFKILYQLVVQVSVV